MARTRHSVWNQWSRLQYYSAVSSTSGVQCMCMYPWLHTDLLDHYPNGAGHFLERPFVDQWHRFTCKLAKQCRLLYVDYYCSLLYCRCLRATLLVMRAQKVEPRFGAFALSWP